VPRAPATAIRWLTSNCSEGTHRPIDVYFEAIDYPPVRLTDYPELLAH
jgi:hypothetical protein